MREIEFRGKKPDWEKMDDFVSPIQSTEWVYGDLIQDPFQMMDECQFSKDEDPYLFSTIRPRDSIPVAVIAETIGQYTGLNDKNGKKIFEGDFLKNGDDIMLVIFRKDLASFALSKKGWLHDHFFKEAVSNSDCEIIGNIRDNPELLR